MNWHRLVKSIRSSQRQASSQVRYRPSLFVLEDRTVLSPVAFTVDPLQSSVALSGTLAGQAIHEQGPGSLTTTAEGGFQADIDDSPGGNGIVFYNNGNDIFADNSGNWQPRSDGSSGAEPANYGGMVNYLGTALAALRHLNWGVDTGGAGFALNDNGDGSFGFSSTQTLPINQADGAYSHPVAGHGTFTLAGQTAQNQASDGTLYDNGDGTFAIVAPVNVSFSGTIYSGISYTLNISGQIVANGAYTGPSPAPGNHQHSANDQALSTDLVSTLRSTGSQLPTNLQAQHDSTGPVGLPDQTLTAYSQFGTNQVQVGGALDTMFRPAPQASTGVPDDLSVVDAVVQEIV
jgi:hypothetical protein